MKLRNKLIATIVSISMVLAVIGVGAWASTESFTATITNTVNLEFDNIKGQISVMGMSGADNLDFADAPSMQEVLYDGSNVIYNQISSSATSGTNLYWAGTRFLDNSEDGLQMVDNETEAAAFGYVFLYSPTEDCVGTSTITAMITETNVPEIAGGKLMVKYFAALDDSGYTEIFSGQPITPIYDNDELIIIAICQYYNIDGVSITTTASAWDFSVTFSAGKNRVEPLTGNIQIEPALLAVGAVLPYDFESENLPYDIIEFGEYPQSLKAANVNIVSQTPDEDGYYLGDDGARYAKKVATINRFVLEENMNVAANGITMNNGEEYYFKVEPIAWRMVAQEGSVVGVIADKALDVRPYQTKDPVTAYGAPEGTSQNNYEYSELRQFFNGEFYDRAFSDEDKARVVEMQISNDAASTGAEENPNAGAATMDKVFALSVAEFQFEGYTFGDKNTQCKTRSWKPTDYALASGAEIITKSNVENIEAVGLDGQTYLGSTFVWTRSPLSFADNAMAFVYIGFVDNSDAGGAPVGASGRAVVPAIALRI